MRDRTLLVTEIAEELQRLAKSDLRVGQIFSIIGSKLEQASNEKDRKDLFFVENDRIIEELKKL